MDRPGGHITPGEVSQSRKDKHCDSTVPGSAVVRFMQKGSRTEVAVAVCVCVCVTVFQFCKIKRDLLHNGVRMLTLVNSPRRSGWDAK